MTGQTWTPAPKRGIIPLHPLTFGMLLGRSFSALRHNPKVLFGFGVVIQLIVVVLSAAVMGFVFATTFARLESLSPSSPDFEAVLAGTIGMNLVAGIAVGLASIAFTALMQGVVAADQMRGTRAGAFACGRSLQCVDHAELLGPAPVIVADLSAEFANPALEPLGGDQNLAYGRRRH